MAQTLEPTTTAPYTSCSRLIVTIWVSVPIQFTTPFRNLANSNSKFNKLGLIYHQEQAYSEVVHWINIKNNDSNFRNPRIKSGNNDSWQAFQSSTHLTNCIDNCDKEIQNQDRECAKFALHQRSADSKLPKKDDSRNPTGRYEMSRQIAAARSIDIEVFQRKFWTT